MDDVIAAAPTCLRAHRKQPPSVTVLNLQALQRCQFMILSLHGLKPKREKTFCAFCIDIHVTPWCR
jgi:hypothetical protein